MENKRQFRELSDDTKQKISLASQGKPKCSTHKLHISQALTNYWASVPSKNNEKSNFNLDDDMQQE